MIVELGLVLGLVGLCRLLRHFRLSIVLRLLSLLRLPSVISRSAFRCSFFVRLYIALGLLVVVRLLHVLVRQVEHVLVVREFDVWKHAVIACC
jgi:hypothetical protein